MIHSDEEREQVAAQRVRDATPRTAEDGAGLHKRRSRRPSRVAALAAISLIALMVTAVVLTLFNRGGQDAKKDTKASVTGMQSLADYAGIGTVMTVSAGTLPVDAPHPYANDPYHLVTIRVDEVLRGPLTTQIVVYDSPADRLPAERNVRWKVGTRMLLFLDPSEGTVHHGIKPLHYQLTLGAHGAYEIRDGELVDAPFTLDEIRAAV